MEDCRENTAILSQQSELAASPFHSRLEAFRALATHHSPRSIHALFQVFRSLPTHHITRAPSGALNVSWRKHLKSVQALLKLFLRVSEAAKTFAVEEFDPPIRLDLKHDLRQQVRQFPKSLLIFTKRPFDFLVLVDEKSTSSSSGRASTGSLQAFQSLLVTQGFLKSYVWFTDF
jgi:hypothetical protein